MIKKIIYLFIIFLPFLNRGLAGVTVANEEVFSYGILRTCNLSSFKNLEELVEFLKKDLKNCFPSKLEAGISNAPKSYCELSKNRKSTKFFENQLKEASQGDTYRFEFIFDPELKAVFLGIPRKREAGHKRLADMTGSTHSCGGEIWRVNETTFRSNELSGHYGIFWNDDRREDYIKLMQSLGIIILHEPFVQDDIREKNNPGISEKIKKFDRSLIETRPQGPKNPVNFALYSADALGKWQKDFLAHRKLRYKLRSDWPTEPIEFIIRSVNFKDIDPSKFVHQEKGESLWHKN